jgi:hypothetical protein
MKTQQTILTCDRCNGQVDSFEGTITPQTDEDQLAGNRNPRQYDLCVDCWKAFLVFLNRQGSR